VGQTEALPITNFLTRFNRMTGGGLMSYVKSGGVSALQEGIQETLQQYLTNQIAREDYDPDRDPVLGLLESFKVGAIVGSLMPGMGRVMIGAPPNIRKKLAEKFVEIEASIAQDETTARLE